MGYTFVDIPTMDSNKINQINKYLLDPNHQIFILFYLDGCGPCNATRPEWNKLQKELLQNTQNKNKNNIIVAQIEQKQARHISKINEPTEFPTIVYVSNSGSILEKYEGERNVDAFVSWIKSKQDKIYKGKGGNRTTKKKKYKRKIKKIHKKTQKKKNI